MKVDIPSTKDKTENLWESIWRIEKEYNQKRRKKM